MSGFIKKETGVDFNKKNFYGACKLDKKYKISFNKKITLDNLIMNLFLKIFV